MTRDDAMLLVLAAAVITIGAGVGVIARRVHAAAWPDRLRREIRELPELARLEVS